MLVIQHLHRFDRGSWIARANYPITLAPFVAPSNSSEHFSTTSAVFKVFVRVQSRRYAEVFESRACAISCKHPFRVDKLYIKSSRIHAVGFTNVTMSQVISKNCNNTTKYLCRANKPYEVSHAPEGDRVDYGHAKIDSPPDREYMRLPLLPFSTVKYSS